jgi:large subunit ribosomal protein L25
MEIGKLTVQSRDAAGKGISRKLRAKGMVPGICYGAGLDKPLSIVVDPRALKASLDPEKRQNTVIDVTVEGAGAAQTVTAMLWEYQIHPIRREVTHVDLISIDPEKTLEAEVPVELTGKYAGQVNGGQLNTARHSVTVSAKPADIPAKLVLDITALDIGDVLHVSDLVIPAGVELVTPAKLTIVTCAAPKAEKVTAEEEAAEAEAAEADAAAAEGGAAPAAKADEGGKKEG